MMEDHKTDVKEEYYEDKEYYEAEVYPLLKQAWDKCEKRRLPFVFAVEYANREDSFGAASAASIPEGRGHARMRTAAALIE